MDEQQATHERGGIDLCRLKLTDFKIRENHQSHQTEGLSKNHLVARRGKPFKVALLFRGRSWNPHNENLVLEVLLGGLSERIHVHFSDRPSSPNHWSAKVHPGDAQPMSVTVHVCSPVLSAVALYTLLVHFESRWGRRSYAVGSFVLLYNPWLKDDPVFMPEHNQREEYIKSDYGMVYMGTELNVSQRPWSFDQYEPGILEACLQLLEVSPQHLSDRNKDYVLRGDPVYLSRVLCAMVNCNDDKGILMGKWQGSYEGGVKPTEWSGSADILRQWVSSKFSPVRYGQCWVFASVLCTVMRVLGIPSRVVTVFNAAHDGDANMKIEEFYSTTGEKLNLSKDSVWNFHVWVESWMRRSDLGEGFDGWQVVDPTPQERSAGVFTCGPCPVAAVLHRCLRAPYDVPFIYASVDADVVRLIVRNGLVVGRKVDTERVGPLIYTKCMDSDDPENLTYNYKKGKAAMNSFRTPASNRNRSAQSSTMFCSRHAAPRSVSMDAEGGGDEEPVADLEVNLKIVGKPSIGNSVHLSIAVKNNTVNSRVLVEHVNAQIKDYNSAPQESFWKVHKEVPIGPYELLTLHHTIDASVYESVLSPDDIVNLAVVIKDMMTEERVLETQEFNISSPKITVEIEGGDTIEANTECKADVSFTNTFTKTLTGAVLTVEGSGLMNGKQDTRLSELKPGKKIERSVSLVARSPGTKVLRATFSHSNSPTAVSRCFHKVSVKAAS